MKAVLVVGPPSLAPTHLDVLYHNQVTGLNAIREADEEEEKNDNQVHISCVALVLHIHTVLVL